MADRRKIILVENEGPQITGRWTVNEIQQMAQALAHWAGSLSVPETLQEPPQSPTETGKKEEK